jgi:nucleoside-diphosphate-sugar epimerase
MNVYVFGSTGFIGRSLVKRLKDEGHVVFTPAVNISLPYDVLQFRENEIDWIFNLACPTKPADYLADPHKTLMACSVGINNLIGLTMSTRATLVHASTVRTITETDHIGKHSCYVEGKRFAETLIMSHQREYSHLGGLTRMGRTCIARMYSTYGPEMNLQTDTRVIPTFIREARANRPLRLYGGGEQMDTFCDIDSVLDDMIALAKGPDSHPVPVGNPVTVTIRELAELIKALCNSESTIEYVGDVAPPDRGGAHGSIEVLAAGLKRMIQQGDK